MRLTVTSLIILWLNAFHHTIAFSFGFNNRLLPLSAAKSLFPPHHQHHLSLRLHANPKNHHSHQIRIMQLNAVNDDGRLHSDSINATNNNDAIQITTTDVVPRNPPRYLRRGYQLATLLNILSAVALLLTNYPNTSNSAQIMTSNTASTTNLLNTRYYYYQPNSNNMMTTITAGALGQLFFAGATCHVLSNSIIQKPKKECLLYTSNTYKRLNMGLLLFGLLGICSFPGEAGCIADNTLGLGRVAAWCTMIVTQLSKVITALVSYYGWEYSVGGFGSSFKEQLYSKIHNLRQGINTVFKTLPVTNERPASFYRTFFLLVSILNPLCNIPELSFNLRQGMGLFSLPVSLNISSMARLILLSVMLYVLKDAADRDRLDGSTFITLNMSIGLWALGVGIAQGLVFGQGGGEFNIRRAADKFLFGLLFLNNGVISILRKMGLMKKGNGKSVDDDPPLRINLF